MIILFLSTNNIVAQNYAFKAENDEGIVIYYNIEDENAIVTFGDEKYTGNVKIPSSVQFNSNTLNVIAIGEKAFYFCQSLKSIDIPSSVTDIADYAFYNCSGLETITFPSKLLSIGDNAFGGCSKLKSIEFPEGLTSLGRNVFNGCDNLSTVKLSSTISKIGVSAFGYTPALSTITVDTNNATYDSRNNCNAIIETSTNTLVTGCKTTKIPENVAIIGDNAFYFCQSLESIDIPSSVTVIADYAFYNCSGLETVTFPSKLLAIRDNAFGGCSKLKSIEFPEGLTSLGRNVFNGCDNLSTVKLSSTISKIGVSAFGNTPALSMITVDANNATFDSRNNCNAIIETSTNTLVTGCKTTKIPDNVAVIGEKAFYFCHSLKSIDIPSSVTAIADNAFYDCISLETVVLPAYVKSIGSNAFGGCESFATIDSRLKNPFEISTNVFDQSTKETATLKVPTGTKNTYQSTAGWEFANIVEKNGGGDNDDDNNNDENNSEISLVVWAKDGSKVAFALSKKPKVIFTATNLLITGKDIDVTYALDNMARFTYEKNDISAIKDIKTEKDVFRFVGESLLFPALKVNSTVSVYSLNGTLVFKKTVHQNGEYVFPLSNLNSGVYMINVNGLTYKIVKR